MPKLDATNVSLYKMTFNEEEWRKRVKLAKSSEELRQLLAEVPIKFSASTMEQEIQSKGLNSTIQTEKTTDG